MIEGEITRERMAKWKIQSSEEPGLQIIATPADADCQQMYLYRLNLAAGEEYELVPDALGKAAAGRENPLEMCGVVTCGMVHLSCNEFTTDAVKLDGFYLSGGSSLKIYAPENSVLYLGGAVYEGYGSSYFRKFQPELPIGDIHQIHGEGSGQREVFMVCGPEAEASRIEAGLTWSKDGTWTSWPPHQHSKDLEEAYMYFDMPAPKFGLHLSYMEPGDIHDVVVHTVTDGTVILAPAGYHPTAASPGSRNSYFWFMAAHSHASRRYDLAVPDPKRA